MATEYERKRLENIRRNDEMMAALNVHAKKASLLSAAAKRPRDDDDSKKKKKETQTTARIVIRKSQRTRCPQKPPAPLSSPLPLDAAAAYAGEKEASSSLTKLAETLSGIATSNNNRRSSRLSNLPPLSSNLHHHIKNNKKKKVSSETSCEINEFDTGVMSLEPCNVARVVKGRALELKFLPCENVRLLAAGDKHGNVGFWNLDCQGDDNDDGIYLFRPHSSPVSSLVFQQNSFSKVISSSYDGLIRLMDVEKSVFDLVYSSDDDAIYSLSQRPNDEQSLYFSEGYGMLNTWDLRAGKSVFHWELHDGQRINTIDFNPEDPNVMATSSTDGTACLWDLRRIGSKKPKELRTVNHHSEAVHSAYFSPSGLSLATTSADNYLGILSGPGLEDSSMIYHENLSNRAISAFRGVWGWDDSYIFIANRSRGVDVISPKLKLRVKELHSPLMKTISCRIHCHPLHVGMLAGSTAGGQVYVWT